MQPESADRRRSAAALALLARHERAFIRTARRWSLCADDADDAFQRAIEILLTKAPPELGRERLAGWMHVVTRREALAVRRNRERLVAVGGSRSAGEGPGESVIDRLACHRPGPMERVERRERFEAAARHLAALKPDQRLAIVLQACGYSYAEIARACGWTYTKVNRSLAEGRERLRELAPAGG